MPTLIICMNTFQVIYCICSRYISVTDWWNAIMWKFVISELHVYEYVYWKSPKFDL